MSWKGLSDERCFPDGSIENRDPVTQSNGTKLLVSKDDVSKPPKLSSKRSDSWKVQVDQCNDPFVHIFTIYVRLTDELDIRKPNPKCLNDRHQEVQTFESVSSSESKFPCLRSLTFKGGKSTSTSNRK